jgi:hypothetical protein
MTAVILIAGRVSGGGGPNWRPALGVAFLISLIGIGFAKYGANFGLPWWIYYTAPMLATVLIPPVAFSFTFPRSLFYVALAFISAPLIHAGFFYVLGWADYMPFLRLPPL